MQQDNDQKHSSKATSEQTSKWDVLAWPKTGHQAQKPSRVAELKQFCKVMWTKSCEKQQFEIKRKTKCHSISEYVQLIIQSDPCNTSSGGMDIVSCRGSLLEWLVCASDKRKWMHGCFHCCVNTQTTVFHCHMKETRLAKSNKLRILSYKNIICLLALKVWSKVMQSCHF